MSDVVPLFRVPAPDVPAARPSVPVLLAHRPADADLMLPEDTRTSGGPGSAGVIVWVAFSFLGAFGIGLGLIIKALWP